MPELPEVEVLKNHLQAILPGRSILGAQIPRARTCRPLAPGQLAAALSGRRFLEVNRRGKYLLFRLSPHRGEAASPQLLAHLGMTGRLYVQSRRLPLPKHPAAWLTLDRGRLVFEDPRYFGRLTLDLSPLGNLGPEPLSPNFSAQRFLQSLRPSRQAIKVRLLDQNLIAGVGNIYASEALFRARIDPRKPACRITAPEAVALRNALRAVLREAIAWGSTVPLNWSGAGTRDRLFYYGRAPDSRETTEERLRVYDRAGQPCPRCRSLVRRIVQANRGTFFCPCCQRR